MSRKNKFMHGSFYTVGSLAIIWQLKLFLWSHMKNLSEDKCSPGSFGIMCLNPMWNKPTFTHNTHKKSVNVYSGHFSTPLFSIRELYFPYSFWVKPGKSSGRTMVRLDILQAGQGESGSLMACSFCRCPLVIILKKPSALPAPAGPDSLQSFGSCVTGRNRAALSSIQTCLWCPVGQSG